MLNPCFSILLWCPEPCVCARCVRVASHYSLVSQSVGCNFRSDSVDRDSYAHQSDVGAWNMMFVQSWRWWMLRNFFPKRFLRVCKRRDTYRLAGINFETWACASNSWIYFWMRETYKMEIENLFLNSSSVRADVYLPQFIRWDAMNVVYRVCNKTHSPTFLNGKCEQCAKQSSSQCQS